MEKKLKLKINKVRGTTKICNDKVTKNIDMDIFEDEPCYVNIKLGETINIGQYESIRIDIGYTIPCKHTDINKVKNKFLDKLKNEIGEERKKIVNELHIKKKAGENNLII